MITLEQLPYKQRMELAIERANILRDVKSSGDLNTKVKKVAVILTSSRGGSSLMKTILSKNNDIAYLSGEEEPFFILTGNGYPWSSDSDSFKDIKNKQKLLDNIFDELGVNTKDFDFKKIIRDWKKRLLLQNPLIQENLLIKAESIWRKIESDIEEYTEYNYLELNQLFLSQLYNDKQDFGYYDIIGENTQFIVNNINRPKIEEPPFVIPEQRRSINGQDCQDKTFIFKTPQDCYRIGIFEQLFPNAEIKYIHLSRGFAQTVNGLMDGWLSETGFFAHNVDITGDKLDILGYTSDVAGGDRWWNFDMPPNWRYYKNKPLEQVCLNQWHESHQSILDSGVETLKIKFEDFSINPQDTLDKITNYLNIKKSTIKKLPLVMVTNIPSPYRWHKRKDIIEALAKEPKTIKMMENLGYSMDPKTWI